MNLDSILNMFSSLGDIIVSAINFLIELPELIYTLLSFIPEPFKTNLLLYVPIIIGIFFYKLWRG